MSASLIRAKTEALASIWWDITSAPAPLAHWVCKHIFNSKLPEIKTTWDSNTMNMLSFFHNPFFLKVFYVRSMKMTVPHL